MRLKKLQDKPSPGSKAAGEPPRDTGCPRAPLSSSGPPRLLAGDDQERNIAVKAFSPGYNRAGGCSQGCWGFIHPWSRVFPGKQAAFPLSFAWDTAVHSPALKETGGLHPRELPGARLETGKRQKHQACNQEGKA